MRTTSAFRATLVGAGLWLAGATIPACDQMEAIDQNFDSSVGADFRAPADPTPDGGATDTANAAATDAAP